MRSCLFFLFTFFISSTKFSFATYKIGDFNEVFRGGGEELRRSIPIKKEENAKETEKQRQLINTTAENEGENEEKEQIKKALLDVFEVYNIKSFSVISIITSSQTERDYSSCCWYMEGVLELFLPCLKSNAPNQFLFTKIFNVTSDISKYSFWVQVDEYSDWEQFTGVFGCQIDKAAINGDVRKIFQRLENKNNGNASYSFPTYRSYEGEDLVNGRV
ncbi:MAG: hypothetical protein K2W92_03245 [Alphaproteobacteria bacterium]|nr:hypothetical protein [Alphaproteobacteria bacterium]